VASVGDVLASCEVGKDRAVDGSADPVDELRACAREVSIATARLLAAAVRVADQAKAGFDADEVAFALAWTQSAARSQVEFGRYLIRTLPPVFGALTIGEIDVRRAWVFADVLAVVDDAIASEIAGAILPSAGALTTSQLRDRLRRAVLKADPDATKRTAKSVSDRHVVCTGDRDGTASLFGAKLPAERATAAFERVDAYARGRKHAGDGRTLDQLRADTFLDLLEGVGIDSAPVHRSGVVELTVPWSTATGAADEPATLAGYGPVDAGTARDIIASQLIRHATGAGRDTVRWRHTLTAPDGGLLTTANIAAPGDPGPGSSSVGGSWSTQPAPVPMPPVEADPGCRLPGTALARWVATRDRTCRAPGCRVPARVADIDHTVDHADGGLTAHDNLAVLCRHHHRLKHEGGWRVTQPEPGTLIWSSPGGHEYRREPDPP
jgi:Domain of unknown function (DUF222)